MNCSPKVAVIGCGYWGKNLVRNFSQLGALEMVCDGASSAQLLVNEIAKGCRTVTNYSDVLLSNVSAVVIATPAETHFRLARQAIMAGKDVFVEKPLAMNYQQRAQLVELADKYNVILMVGHVLEYHPGVLRLLELIENDVLGKVRYIYSNRLSLGKVRREENILWSFAPHDIAILLRMMGRLPIQVVACGASYLQPNIADVTVTNLLFDNGVRSHIYVSWLHPFKEQRLVVIGSQRMANLDDVNKKLLLFDQRVEVLNGDPVPVTGEGEEIEFEQQEPLKQECKAFLNAIRTRHPPTTDGLSGLNVLKVLEAAQHSLVMNGQQISFPLETTMETVRNGRFATHVVRVDDYGRRFKEEPELEVSRMAVIDE
ncbi:Gfo/Idh/MocA family oxidoreductase [bacterium]|nr:Gfo/Idh/MocA family oxidoreductase [bacterium]